MEKSLAWTSCPNSEKNYQKLRKVSETWVQFKIETEDEVDDQEMDDEHKISVEYSELQQEMELFL